MIEFRDFYAKKHNFRNNPTPKDLRFHLLKFCFRDLRKVSLVPFFRLVSVLKFLFQKKIMYYQGTLWRSLEATNLRSRLRVLVLQDQDQTQVSDTELLSTVYPDPRSFRNVPVWNHNSPLSRNILEGNKDIKSVPELSSSFSKITKKHRVEKDNTPRASSFQSLRMEPFQSNNMVSFDRIHSKGYAKIHVITEFGITHCVSQRLLLQFQYGSHAGFQPNSRIRRHSGNVLGCFAT